MRIIFKKNEEVHPENILELEALSKKWKITLPELCRAIVETGTTNTRQLKDHILKGKQSIKSSYILKKIYSHLHIVGRNS